jgi:hypothetical protein
MVIDCKTMREVIASLPVSGGGTKQSQMTLFALSLLTTFISVMLIFSGSMNAFGRSNERIAFSQESERDPFSLPSGVYLLYKAKTVQVTNAPSHLQRLKAILIGDYIRLALVDRHIVTVGDSINGEKVLEIKPDRVILGKGDKKRNLFLYQSPIPLKVEEK